MNKNKVPTNYFIVSAILPYLIIICLAIYSLINLITIEDFARIFYYGSYLVATCSFMISLTAWKVIKDERK